MYSPNPVPWNDFVVNFVKRFGNISSSIPIPVSLILAMIMSIFWSIAFSILIDIFPSLKINFIELLIKFEMTWPILFLSPYIINSSLHSLVKYSIFILLFFFNPCWNSLAISSMRFSIANFSSFRFNELISIFDTSKISSDSFFNFFAFLIMISSNSICSLSFVFFLDIL